jgi:hypothetical protein
MCLRNSTKLEEGIDRAVVATQDIATFEIYVGKAAGLESSLPICVSLPTDVEGKKNNVKIT